jgi:glycosyltransferase involved in cell wall biosynthesis
MSSGQACGIQGEAKQRREKLLKPLGHSTIVLACGRLSPSIGGPFNTILNYRSALAGAGADVVTLALKPLSEQPFSSGPDYVWCDFSHRSFCAWARLLHQLVAIRNSTAVVFGVWHPVFFFDGFLRLLHVSRGRRFLVPTQSLSPIDWQKRSRVKRALRQLVFAIVRRFDRVIFASHGELRVSVPSVGDNLGAVIYHPLRLTDPPQRHEGGPPRAAFFARVHPQKDLPLFLQAAELLPRTWAFDVIGGGDDAYAQELQAQVPASLRERVIWHGWKEQREAHKILAGATVMLVTSVDENYCHAAVEAMAIGVPVVMVDRIAAADDLQRNGTGIVCRTNPREVAAAASRLLDDEGLREGVVARGRDFAQLRSGPETDNAIRRIVLDEHEAVGGEA